MFKRLVFTVSLFIISLAVVFISGLVGKEELERDLRAQHLKAGDFELEYEGKPFKLRQMKGNPVILYFGYTFCPDVCPVGLAKIRDVLTSSGAFNEVQALFVTLDPERDTSARLREYTAFFHPNIKGLRGEPEQIKKMSAAYGTFFRIQKDKNEGAEEYVVDHSAYVYLIDKDGSLIRVLDHDVQTGEIAELLHKLL